LSPPQDPNAFFYVSSITDITGEGFTYTHQEAEEKLSKEQNENPTPREIEEESPAEEGEMF